MHHINFVIWFWFPCQPESLKCQMQRRPIHTYSRRWIKIQIRFFYSFNENENHQTKWSWFPYLKGSQKGHSQLPSNWRQLNSTQLLTNYQNVMLSLSLATSVSKLDPIRMKIRTAALKRQIRRDIRYTALGRHY